MDIVERLRNNKGGESYTWKTIKEAADEIDRLRQQKAELVEVLKYVRKHMDLNPYGDCDMIPEFDHTVVESAIAKATGGE